MLADLITNPAFITALLAYGALFVSASTLLLLLLPQRRFPVVRARRPASLSILLAAANLLLAVGALAHLLLPSRSMLTIPCGVDLWIMGAGLSAYLSVLACRLVMMIGEVRWNEVWWRRDRDGLDAWVVLSGDVSASPKSDPAHVPAAHRRALDAVPEESTIQDGTRHRRMSSSTADATSPPRLDTLQPLSPLFPPNQVEVMEGPSSSPLPPRKASMSTRIAMALGIQPRHPGLRNSVHVVDDTLRPPLTPLPVSPGPESTTHPMHLQLPSHRRNVTPNRPSYESQPNSNEAVAASYSESLSSHGTSASSHSDAASHISITTTPSVRSQYLSSPNSPTASTFSRSSSRYSSLDSSHRALLDESARVRKAARLQRSMDRKEGNLFWFYRRGYITDRKLTMISLILTGVMLGILAIVTGFGASDLALSTDEDGCTASWPYSPVYAMVFIYICVIFPTLAFMGTRVPEVRGLRRDLFPVIGWFSSLLLIGLIIGWVPEANISATVRINVRSALLLLGLIGSHTWLVLRPTWLALRAAVRAADQAAAGELPTGQGVSPMSSHLAIESGLAAGTRRGFEAVLNDSVRFEEFKRFCATDLGIAYPVFYSLVTRILRGGSDVSPPNNILGGGDLSAPGRSGFSASTGMTPSPLVPNAPPPSAATPSSPTSVPASPRHARRGSMESEGTASVASSGRSAPRRRRDLHLLHHLHLRSNAPLPVEDLSARTLTALRHQFRSGEVTLAALGRAREECMSRLWLDVYPRFLLWKHESSTGELDEFDDDAIMTEKSSGAMSSGNATSGRRTSRRGRDMAWVGLGEEEGDSGNSKDNNGGDDDIDQEKENAQKRNSSRKWLF